MNDVLDIAIEGVGLIAPGLANWNEARDVLTGAREFVAAPLVRPAPQLLAANERRRAPDSVLLALGAAEQACAAAQRDARDLASVFASSYGDLAINDYLCTQLAQAPKELSPTQFHHSVHNAAVGYWTIATGSHATSTALSAGIYTFGMGLLEAALLAHCENTPVLYVAYDVPARGPLRDVIACDSAFAAAFVLVPAAGANKAATRLRLHTHTTVAPGLALARTPLHDAHKHNPAATSLPLLTALARRAAASLALAIAPQSALSMEIAF